MLGQPVDDFRFTGWGMKISVGIGPPLELADLDDMLCPLVQQAEDFIVDPVDFLPARLQFFRRCGSVFHGDSAAQEGRHPYSQSGYR
jgi:hypothetical protein